MITTTITPLGEVSTSWFLPSKETRSEQRLSGTLAHHSNLLRAMDGDPAQWEYTGAMTERKDCGGTCACGHTGLRYEFFIRHKTSGKEIIVGSSCINAFDSVNPALVAAISDARDRAEKAAAARIKAAKELLQDDEIKQLTQELGDAMTKAVLEVARVGNYGTRTKYWFFERYGYASRIAEMVRYETRDGSEYRAKVSLKQYKIKSAMIKDLKQRLALWSQSPIA